MGQLDKFLSDDQQNFAVAEAKELFSQLIQNEQQEGQDNQEKGQYVLTVR